MLGSRAAVGWRGATSLSTSLSFDEGSLRRLLKECGLHVLRGRYPSITMTADFAMRRLSDLTGCRRIRLPSWAARLAVRVKPLYDLVIIAEAVRTSAHSSAPSR